MHEHCGITVREALSLVTVNRLTLAGGGKGVDRVIKLVNAAETSGAMEHLREGEFLLTSGRPFHESPGLAALLIPRMAKQGCAGLAINPRHCGSSIPPLLIETADEHGIPLLEVPDELTFSEIISAILNYILEKQAATIQELVEQNCRAGFLEVLLSGDFENEAEITRQAGIFNIDIRKPLAVIMINDNSFDEMAELPQSMDRPGARETLMTALHDFYSRRTNYIAGSRGRNIVFIAEIAAGDTSENLKRLTAGLLEQLAETVPARLELRVGVGRPYTGIRNIKRSCREAQEALKICRLSGGSNQVYFDELGFYKIISEKNREELERFVVELLQPVIAYDRAKNGELVSTLETYYEMNRNLKLTSKKMLTHYNTILYRVKKIEELTGINLGNPESALNLEIAVNILKLFRTDKE